MKDLLTVSENMIKGFDDIVSDCYRIANITEDLDGIGNIGMDGIRAICEEWLDNNKSTIVKWNGTRLSTTVYGIDKNEAIDIINDFAYRLRHGNGYTMNRKSVETSVIKYRYGYDRPEERGRFVEFNVAISKICSWLTNYENIDNVVANAILEDVDNWSTRDMKELVPYKKGEKVSKIIVKALRNALKASEGLSDDEREMATKEIDIISQNYSKYVEKIKQSNCEATVYLSVDVRDFFRCSYGYDWMSCHRLGGEYGSGAINYALNPHCAIAYVEKNDGDGIERLAWRQIVYFDVEQNVFVGSRQYKNENKQYADAVMDMIKEMYTEKKLNTYSGFTFNHSDYDCEDMQELAQCLIMKNYSSFAYNDIHLYSGISRHLWALLPVDLEDFINYKPIDIQWSHIYCVDCGERMEKNEYESEYVHCENCRDEMVYCEQCGDYHPMSECTYVETASGYVCSDCLEEYYVVCEDCDESDAYHHIDNVYYIEGYGYVCESCYEYGDYYCCPHCGCNYKMDEMVETESGDYVCEDCLNYYYTQCEDCEKFVHNDDIVYIESENKYVCSECACEYDEE